MEEKHIPSKNYFTYVARTNMKDLPELAAVEVDKLYAASGELQLEINGPLEFIYFDAGADMEKEFLLEIALPVKETKLDMPLNYSLKKHEDFKCLSYIHKGDLTQLYSVYEKLYADMWNNSQRPTNQIREVYTKFVDMSSAENVTEIQIGLQ